MPLEHLLDRANFLPGAPEVYNYARLGFLIARAVMKEYISELSKSKIFSRTTTEIAKILTCITNKLTTIREYRTNMAYEEVGIKNEVAEQIALDILALRAIYESFHAAAYLRSYLFEGLEDKLTNNDAQFFLIYAQNFCYWESKKKIEARLKFKNEVAEDLHKTALEYYRVILSLKNIKGFSEAFNCRNTTRMSFTPCL